MIKDSGNRTEFSSGAVRDIQEGKGRCDLMPLDVVADITKHCELAFIEDFRKSGDVAYLYAALGAFCDKEYAGFDETMMLEVSKHFEEGAKKYGEYNWQKGISIHSFMNSAIRHLLKHRSGWDDESHDKAFVWNVMCAIWTMIHKPEEDDFTVDGQKLSETPEHGLPKDAIEHVNCRCHIEFGHSEPKKPKLPKWMKHIEKSLERMMK